MYYFAHDCNIIVVSIFDCVKGIRLCSTVHHKYGHANRGTEIICIAFVASIFCYSKRSSTIQQSLQYVKGNLAYRNFQFLYQHEKLLQISFEITLQLIFVWIFHIFFERISSRSWTLLRFIPWSMNSYPIFTNHKRIKTKVENKFCLSTWKIDSIF